MTDLTIGPVTVDTADVDCDVTGVILTAATVLDRTIIVRGEGGHGWWVDSDTGEPTEVERLTEFGFTASLTGSPRRVWRTIRDQLIEWTETGQALRFVALPDHNILYDGDQAIPLPRRDYRTWGGR